LVWFLTRKRWDKKQESSAMASTREEAPSVLGTEHIEI